jgi:predicted amidohydrolase
MDPFRIVLAQIEPTLYDKSANLVKAEQAVRRAAHLGAQAIVFPELYLAGYSLGGRAVEMAETVEGPSISRMADLAGVSRMAVIMGYPELSPDGAHVFDSAFIADSQGRIAGNYRKIHLYQDENRWFIPGEEPCVLDFGLGPVGVLVCYDLEFPEAARELALRGAGWVAVCTGNMLPNRHLQQVYLQARAAENRIWVALANRVGQEANLTFFGGSGVADPNGDLVAEAGTQETLLVAEIDLGKAARAKLNADYLADRKPDLYRTWSG